MTPNAEIDAHQREPRRELGYTRDVCSECGIDWPCPDVAQCREAVANAPQPPITTTPPRALQQIKAEAWAEGFWACQMSRHSAHSSDNPYAP